MGAFVVYILEWSACLLAFLLLYKMCFSGTTFHRFNRLYLLGTTVLSAILPVIHIAPSEQMEPVAEACRTTVWVDESPLSSLSLDSALTTVTTESLSPLTTVATVLLVAYVLYVLTQLVGWGKACVKMLWFLRGKRHHRLGRWVRVVEHDAEYGPFSWMNCIVISRHEQGFGRRASMRHELSHIRLMHHLDLVLLMACVIVNPTCWLLMKEIKIVHEYEADDEVINHYRIQSRDYQRLLVMRTVGAEAYALASSFNLNIKKRIMMMKKQQSHWWRIAWMAVTLPLVGFSLMAFSKPKEALKEAVDNSVRVIEQPLAQLAPTVSDGFAVGKADPTPPAPVAEPQKQTDKVKAGNIKTGRIVNEMGQPLMGCNIVEVDEVGRVVAHAVTDQNGNYTLKVVNANDKIRISYVGYKTKTLDMASKQDATQDKQDVALEPAMKINDVVVVSRSLTVDRNSPRYKDDANDTGGDDVFNLVEQAPSYPGGIGEMMKYLSSHLKYPQVAEEMRVGAEVVVRFTVDKTGFVRSPQVVEVNAQSPLLTAEIAKAAKDGDAEAVEVSKNYYDAVEALKEEAIHLVRSMPRWEPGRQNGKRIATTYTLPISFKMQ